MEKSHNECHIILLRNVKKATVCVVRRNLISNATLCYSSVECVRVRLCVVQKSLVLNAASCYSSAVRARVCMYVCACGRATVTQSMSYESQTRRLPPLRTRHRLSGGWGPGCGPACSCPCRWSDNY